MQKQDWYSDTDPKALKAFVECHGHWHPRKRFAKFFNSTVWCVGWLRPVNVNFIPMLAIARFFCVPRAASGSGNDEAGIWMESAQDEVMMEEPLHVLVDAAPASRSRLEEPA